MTAALLLGNFLDQSFAGNPVRDWIEALIAFVVSVFVLGVAKKLVVLRLSKIAERTETDLDDLVVDLVRRTGRFFLVALGLYFAHHWLTFSGTAERYVENLVALAVSIQAGLWGLGLVQFGIHRMTRGRTAEDPARTMGASVLGFIGRLLVWLVVLLGFLEAIHYPVGSLLASLGVGGIAV